MPPHFIHPAPPVEPPSAKRVRSDMDNLMPEDIFIADNPVSIVMSNNYSCNLTPISCMHFCEHYNAPRNLHMIYLMLCECYMFPYSINAWLFLHYIFLVYLSLQKKLNPNMIFIIRLFYKRFMLPELSVTIATLIPFNIIHLSVIIVLRWCY